MTIPSIKHHVILLISAFIGMLSSASACYASDWADFYKAFAQKKISVTFDQQTFDNKSETPPVIHREFSYHIVSPTEIERSGLETDAVTGAVLNRYTYKIKKAEPLVASGDRFRFQTVDIQDNMIINSFYDRGALFSELRIFISPNHCTAAFTVDLIEDETIQSRPRSLLKCTLTTIAKVAAPKPAAKSIKKPNPPPNMPKKN